MTEKKRGRPRKNLNPNPSPNPNPNPSGEEDSNLDPVNDLEISIEDHAPQDEPEEKGFGSFLKKAADKAGLFDSDSKKIETRGRKSQKANQEEFNTLVVALLTLILSFANIPPQIKPNDSEIGIFSNHLSGIMIRHLPIAKGMSADALDIIGMFAVVSAYYARIAPEIKAMQTPRQATRVEDKQGKPDPRNERVESLDPISRASGPAGEFLRHAAKKPGESPQ